MNPKLLLGFALVLSGGLFGCSNYDERVESVTLPSGEILENHTYYDASGMDGERYNKLFLKNPVTGKSELVGDLNYEQRESLFTRFPHPLEFVHGNEKVLVIGSIVCKRWDWKKGPYWYIVSFDTVENGVGGREYLESYLKADAMSHDSHGSVIGGGPALSVHYICDNLDLESNVLTVKKVSWDQRLEFPDYLVYSACGYNGGSGYGFQWKFDEARTRAKNGPRWEKPMPFKMALDYSIITFPTKAGFMPHEEKRDVALAHAGARELAATSLVLSDQELRGAECKYDILTNSITDKIEAMYGYACAETNRFYIVWEPRNPAAWQSAAMLNLDEWSLVGEGGFEGNIFRAEYIRLRKIKP